MLLIDCYVCMRVSISISGVHFINASLIKVGLCYTTVAVL